MFCKRCGAKIDDGAKFCGACGAVISKTPQAPPTAKAGHKRIGMISCGIAAIIIIACFLTIFNIGEKPEVVTEKYVKAVYGFDYDTVNKYSAINVDTIVKQILSVTSLSDNDIARAFISIYGTSSIKKIYEGPLKKQAQDILTAQYGKDYTYKIDIISKTGLPLSERTQQIDSLNSSFKNVIIGKLIDVSNIKAICHVNGNIIVNGKGDSQKAFNVLCVKIGGKWKVLSNPYSLFSFY